MKWGKMWQKDVACPVHGLAQVSRMDEEDNREVVRLDIRILSFTLAVNFGGGGGAGFRETCHCK
jgi:hypothetical protein